MVNVGKYIMVNIPDMDPMGLYTDKPYKVEHILEYLTICTHAFLHWGS